MFKYIKYNSQGMHSLRKANRILHPLNDNALTPETLHKYPLKGSVETNADLHSNPPLQEFMESPDLVLPRRTEELTPAGKLTELNQELDKNLDDIIALLNRRKHLMASKKRVIAEQAEETLARARMHDSSNHIEMRHDQELAKIVSFASSQQTATRMLGRIMQTMPEGKGPRVDEEQRSEQFWARNRKLETDIDGNLEKLKHVDKQLERENSEVMEICRELDQVEDRLKSFAGAKTPDHYQKIEPLFNAKKLKYDTLNRKIKERQVSKDKKIEYIKRIRNILQQLKRIREERLQQIAEFFGVEDCSEFDQMDGEGADFASGIQELLRVKEKDQQLELAQREVGMELQGMEREQDRIYNELLRKFSEEAKAFHNFSSIQSQRVKYARVLAAVEAETQGLSFAQIDPKEHLRKFRDMKNFFKRFLDEDVLLKQGLVKTSETTKTFVGLLKATENEKERRHELLRLLETCIRKRGEYEQKREQMRNIQFEESRNQQELTQHEEDLEAVLTDGDLEGYKKLGVAIGKCEGERGRLGQVREVLQRQMEMMDREVLSLANRIQEEYEDILADVLPSDYEYSLKSGEDVKKLRNMLRRMYKRLGLLGTD